MIDVGFDGDYRPLWELVTGKVTCEELVRAANWETEEVGADHAFRVSAADLAPVFATGQEASAPWSAPDNAKSGLRAFASMGHNDAPEAQWMRLFASMLTLPTSLYNLSDFVDAVDRLSPPPYSAATAFLVWLFNANPRSFERYECVSALGILLGLAMAHSVRSARALQSDDLIAIAAGVGANLPQATETPNQKVIGTWSFRWEGLIGKLKKCAASLPYDEHSAPNAE